MENSKMTDIEILCVDDDIRMLSTIEDILINAGYAVTLAKSGEQAIEYLSRGFEYQLILLDVDMPGMDGYQTLEEIRKINVSKNTPIIFLTGMDGPDYQIRGYECGAADYITKPFVKSIFLAQIKNRITVSTANMDYDQSALEELTKVLSSTELIVAKYIADGYSNVEIAERMQRKHDYIKHVSSAILGKTSMKNRSDIRIFLKEGKK